ncbi:hypothetical protein Btru_010980 [Bulinus truncatus]|nr:hypothetical protein Btru_010980 [Bulinus truncatus]
MNFFLDIFYPEKRRREKEQRERQQRAAAEQVQTENPLVNPAYFFDNNLYVHGGLDYTSDGYISYGGRSHSRLRHPGEIGMGYNSDGYVCNFNDRMGYPINAPFDGGGHMPRLVPRWKQSSAAPQGKGDGVPGNVGNDRTFGSHFQTPQNLSNRGSVRDGRTRTSQGSGFPGMFGRTRSRTLVFPFRRERGSFWGTFRLKYDPRLLEAKDERTRWKMTMLYCWNNCEILATYDEITPSIGYVIDNAFSHNNKLGNKNVAAITPTSPTPIDYGHIIQDKLSLTPPPPLHIIATFSRLPSKSYHLRDATGNIVGEGNNKNGGIVREILSTFMYIRGGDRASFQ